MRATTYVGAEAARRAQAWHHLPHAQQLLLLLLERVALCSNTQIYHICASTPATWQAAPVPREVVAARARPEVAAVASGGEDGSLCVWGLDSRKLLQREPGAAAGGAGHGAATLCIAAHPTRPVVLTGGQELDCAIKVWSAE